jgi:phenylacetate-CoA ligase
MFKAFQDVSLTARGALAARHRFQAIERASPDAIREYQIRALREVLSSASREVPYYRDLFWARDFDPAALRAPEGIATLPLMTKAILRERMPELIAGTRTRGALRFRTSGTTGERVTVYTSPDQWVVEQAAIWRHWSWAGYRFRDRMAIFRSYAPKPGEPLSRFDRVRNWMFFSPYHLDEASLLDHLRTLSRWRPKFLRGYPSSLFLLAKVARQHGIRLPSLVGALTASEMLTDEYREEIENAFGIRCFDHYGQAEITGMFHECEAHGGMHAIEYYGYVEFLPTADPRLFRLVATNLHNLVMPLIRYDTGDLVELAEGRCACGRTFRKVSRIHGRSDQFLVHRDGTRLPTINFYTYFAKRDDLLRFQVVQHVDSSIDVRVQPVQGALSAAARQSIDAEMTHRFGKPVNLIATDEFIVSGEGKCNAVVQEMR